MAFSDFACKMTSGLFQGLEIVLAPDCPKHFHTGPVSEGSHSVLVFVEKIKDGTAARLNNPQSKKEHNLFHLLHWIPSNEFFVSVSRFRIRSDHALASPIAVLKEVMPASRFCKHYGEIETKHYIRAGKKAYAKENSSGYYAWRHEFLKWHDPSFYQDLKLRKVEVIITYRGEDHGQELHATLGRPDVPNVFLEREGIHNAMHHPNFWDWFYKAIQERGDRFVEKMERATGIFLRVIDESPISISLPAHA